ncbi:recombinase family protein [Candidatus Parcubacteria bacterium]|nr:recombinase family protein [Candidatus Parcubacteria bacterium]
MKEAIIYVRVSSHEQKQEDYSIPTQKKLLKEYAKANDFEYNF